MYHFPAYSVGSFVQYAKQVASLPGERHGILKLSISDKSLLVFYPAMFNRKITDQIQLRSVISIAMRGPVNEFEK